MTVVKTSQQSIIITFIRITDNTEMNTENQCDVIDIAQTQNTTKYEELPIIINSSNSSNSSRIQQLIHYYCLILTDLLADID